VSPSCLARENNMTIKWKILQLDRTLADGGVFSVYWDVTAISDTATDAGGDSLTARIFNAISVTADPDAPDFIAYADLTENDCLGWVWQQVSKDDTEARLTAELEALENPTTGDGVPW